MAKILWDQSNEHFYETGVKQGVLYVQNSGVYSTGVPWNGLTAVTESPSGAEETALYADDDKYLSLRSKEQFGGTIEAYTYPDEFEQCDGSANLGNISGVAIGQQSRKPFGFCYRTTVGNDGEGNDYGYKLHIVYGATASPSERAYATINDSPEAITLSWEFSTVPVAISSNSVGNIEHNKTSRVTIDYRKYVGEESSSGYNDRVAKFKALENVLYGIDEPEEYDSTKTYNVGDMVKHTEGSTEKYYVCNTASTTGTWDASKWTETTIEARLPLPEEIYTILLVTQG